MNIKNIFIGDGIKRLNSLARILLSTFILAICTSLLVEYCQRSRSFTQVLVWIYNNFYNFLLSTLFILFIYLLILSVVGNYNFSSVIGLLFFSVIAYSNLEKLSTLGEPLYPVDFYHLGYLRSLISVIGSSFSYITIVIASSAIIALMYLVKKFPRLSITSRQRLVLFLISSFVINSFTNFNDSFLKEFVQAAEVKITPLNQPENYNSNGFIFGMLSNLQTEIVTQPDNYSEEVILQIIDKYKKEAKELNKDKLNSENEKPNIVFILSETFWDLTRLDSLIFNEDPMKNIREIMSKHSSGSLLSPTLGGDTANVEFEILTGFSMFNISPGAIPYQQAMSKKDFIPSIVSLLESKYYRTIAVHPYNKDFYKRDKVYDVLGFNEFISEKEMFYKETLGGPYISDQAVMDEIINLIETSEGPVFIHAVTGQNHVPIYEGKLGANTISIEGLDQEAAEELETYAQGIKLTDVAIENLIHRLSYSDEPTIVVFYGDQLPALNSSIYEKSGFHSADQYENERLYSETPLFIYSNFDTDHMELKTLSPAFLGLTISNILRQPLTPFYALLESIRSELPGLKATVLVDYNGESVTEISEEVELLLKEYKLIQYDILVGSQYSLPLFLSE